MEVNNNCLDLLYFDVVEPFIATTESLNEGSKTYHVPAFFGDDFAYEDAAYNFNFIQLLSKHVEERSL